MRNLRAFWYPSRPWKMNCRFWQRKNMQVYYELYAHSSPCRSPGLFLYVQRASSIVLLTNHGQRCPRLRHQLLVMRADEGDAETRQELRLFLPRNPYRFSNSICSGSYLSPVWLRKHTSNHKLSHISHVRDLIEAYDCPLGYRSISDVLSIWIRSYRSRTFSENGPQLTSHYFRHVLVSLGVKAVLTPTYHSMKNGQTERYNRKIISCLYQ